MATPSAFSFSATSARCSRPEATPTSFQRPQLDQTLVDMPERPWASASNGKPMTPQKRGQMLKHYGIRTTKVRDGGKPVNAYLRSELEPAWEAWLSPCAPASEPEHRNSR